MMPELTGPELIVAVREREDLSTMPIVMMTARTESDSRPDAIEAGATLARQCLSHYGAQPSDLEPSP